MSGARASRAALEAPFRAARYEVTGASPPFALAIDVPSARLLDCQRVHAVDCSAFITAANPAGEQRGADDNDRAHVRLVGAVRERGCTALRARAVDPTGRWPDEESLLVLGLSPTHAAALARELGQAAVVVAGADAVPRLLWLD
ncbi:MAG: DUF3293 domain-containing protein [Proteobacteria bacterium]|nr:DUF3293 domain-containing protein [Pseudomonadota bacterium]